MSAPNFTWPGPDATWVFAGDSITQGIVHTHGARGWVELLAEHIRWTSDRLTDVVINSGMSGWTAPMVLERYDHLIGRFTPDVVNIALGTNDAYMQYDDLDACRAALTTLIHRSRDAGAQVIVHGLITGVTGFRQFRPRWDQFVTCVRDVAADTNTLYVDHDAHWRQHFGDHEPIAWMDDAIHPNAAGHQQIALLTARTLGIGDPLPPRDGVPA